MKQPKTLILHKLIKRKETNQGRKHLNKKFYTSYKWTKFRKGYIAYLTHKQLTEIPEISLPDPYKLTLLDEVPVCEYCYDRYIKGFQPGVNKGRELDHIKPINPDNALMVDDKWGEPLDTTNVQLLCNRCHSEKSGHDKIFINKTKSL